MQRSYGTPPPPPQKKKETATSTLRQICPFEGNGKEPPRDILEVEKKIQGMQLDLQRLVERSRNITSKSNCTKQERDAVVARRSKDDVTITRSDIGGEIVVMSSSKLMNLCIEHLNDRSTNEKLRKDPKNSIRFKINKTLDTILTRCDFPSGLIDQLTTPTTALTQTFYALPKLKRIKRP